jgi:hypothetical protein
MASIRKEVFTRAHPDRAWEAARDVGALYGRLMRGFVVATVMEPASAW